MNLVVYGLLAGMIGVAITGGELAGFLIGGLGGVLAGWVSTLVRRVERLEAQVTALARVAKAAPTTVAQAPTEVEAPAAAPVPPVVRDAASPSTTPPATPTPSSPAAATAAARTPAAARAAASGAQPTNRPAPRPRIELAPSPFDNAVEYVKRWFTTGNVPVKVGVVLSVFGVAFLVKEGIDRQWLLVPLEVRLALVGLFGIALLVLGWRLRAKDRTYALSVQGGGIAVLYLTTYASFALFDLLPAGAAFALMLVITAAAGALAVLQDSRALAVLGIVGGFMAPVLVSTGSGDHVALFSYYAILNLAIVGIAWFKAWRELNLLGFVFTFGIGSLWGMNGYTPAEFGSTEPFLILFVLMYIAIPVLFASREAPELRGFVDGTLTFGTPIVGFALQHQLVGDTEFGLAISALALAAIYVSLATWLLRRGAAEMRVMAEAQLALAVAFVTVAIPLALDARWTSAAWALQGAAMVWLGFRQQRRLALAAGVALQLLSGAAYFNQPGGNLEDIAVLNGRFLGALLLALAGWFSGRAFDLRERAGWRSADDADDDVAPAAAPSVAQSVAQSRTQRRDAKLAFPLVASAFLVWASAWWLFGGLAEVDRFVAYPLGFAASLLFVAATGVVAIVAADRSAWPRLSALGFVLWPAALFGAVLAPFETAHPAQHLGWLAWPALLGAMFTFLRAREEQFPLLRPLLHATAYWLGTWLLMQETHWLVDQVADGVWADAAALGVGAAVVLATLKLRERIAWPLAANLDSYVKLGCGGATAALVLATVFANGVLSGDAAPLPYVPLLNPLELVSVLVCFTLLQWLGIRGDRWPALEIRHRAAIATVFGWYLLTMAVARAVHHWADVPFAIDAMSRSTVLQSSLSIVWGASALIAMLIGARSGRRVVWLTGAALMGVVVVKLFLVELGNSGTLARIVSFLGVGLLLLVVGYFAPVPPRVDLEKRSAA